MSLPALAVFAAGATAPDSSSMLLQFGFVPLILLIFYFLLIRPQMQQQKAQKAKLAAIKKGDQVLTGGGFLGKVVRVDDEYADVELAPGIKVKTLKSTITDVIPPGGSAAND
jgi:preprotein translocase subunit YajC